MLDEERIAPGARMDEALEVGASFVLDARFSASKFWDICREKNITAFNYLGAVIPMLWKQPPRNDDADNPVRIAFGAACPLDVWEPFEKRFGLRLVEGYGSTEVGLAMANTPAASSSFASWTSARAASISRPWTR